MTLIDNPSLLELRLNALIDKKIGDLFPPHENVWVFSREMVQLLLRQTVREALDFYREDFAVGMRKVLETARANAMIPSQQ